MKINEKKVDENWKRQAEREKESTEREVASEQPQQSLSFQQIVSVFATQAMFQLGELVNPLTQEPTLDLAGARYSIDLLKLLEQKTRGNLTPEENKYLTQVIYQLQMQYVAKAGVGG